MNNLTLVIPEKPDKERNAVAKAWIDHGGKVLRLGRFWDPPPLDPLKTKVYGGEAFCRVLQQKIGLELISPSDDLILQQLFNSIPITLPKTVVIDFALIQSTWKIIEFNPSWGAGLNNCDPNKIISCL